MSTPLPRPNKYFRLVIATGGLFAFTALCMFASALGDPQAPPNRFFDRYGIALIVVETAALVLSALVALTVDRRESLAAIREQQARESNSNPSANAITGHSGTSAS